MSKRMSRSMIIPSKPNEITFIFEPTSKKARTKTFYLILKKKLTNFFILKKYKKI
jgi:hypothetical protein